MEESSRLSVAMAIVGRAHPPIEPRAPDGVFPLAEPDGLRELLIRAGFDDVRIGEIEFHLRFAEFEDYWTFVREFAGAVAILFRCFSDQERAAVREATERATKGRATISPVCPSTRWRPNGCPEREGGSTATAP